MEGGLLWGVETLTTSKKTKNERSDENLYIFCNTLAGEKTLAREMKIIFNKYGELIEYLFFEKRPD